MRCPASEKAEIIELVEQSHLPAKRTLDKLGIGERGQPAHRYLLNGSALAGGRPRRPRPAGSRERARVGRLRGARRD